MVRLRPGGWAWVGLAFYVTIVDVVLIKLHQKHGQPYTSMSEVFGDGVKHPINRWPLMLTWTLITLHLFGHLIPDRFSAFKKLDPIGFLARLLGGVARKEELNSAS